MHGSRQGCLGSHLRSAERLEEVADCAWNLSDGGGGLPAHRPGLPAHRPGAAFESRHQPFRDCLLQQGIGIRKALTLEGAQGSFEIGFSGSGACSNTDEAGATML